MAQRRHSRSHPGDASAKARGAQALFYPAKSMQTVAMAPLIESKPFLSVLSGLAFVAMACGQSGGEGNSEDDGNWTTDDGLDFGDPGAPSGSGGSSNAVTIHRTLPTDFSPADPQSPSTSKGGYRVLGPLAEVAVPEGECGNILRVILRDFESSHDDFENPEDWSPYEVESPIGPTRKPQKLGQGGPLRFEEWYQNLEGVNLPFAVDLWLEPVGETFVFDSTAFFPLDDHGFMDSYLFTTELHTNFVYHGGEVFTFRGDDDVFVFVNGHEAVNLSGVHIAQEGAVALDEVAERFGLVIGRSYTFDLFQAERQQSESNFRLETTLDFTGCGEVLPGDVIIR